MSEYARFFLGSRASIVQFETIEITHPAFSRAYRLVRNATQGIVAGGVAYDYYPLRIRSLGARDNLDYGIAVDLGDLGDVLPAEIDRVLAAASAVKPTVRYRTFRSDDLTTPLFGPVTLQVTSIAMRRDGASFEARAPSLALARTGETYDLDRFKSLRGVL